MDFEDLDQFFLEKQFIMAIPDEDFAEYEARISQEKQRRKRVRSEKGDRYGIDGVDPKKAKPDESHRGNSHAISRAALIPANEEQGNCMDDQCDDAFFNPPAGPTSPDNLNFKPIPSSVVSHSITNAPKKHSYKIDHDDPWKAEGKMVRPSVSIAGSHDLLKEATTSTFDHQISFSRPPERLARISQSAIPSVANRSDIQTFISSKHQSSNAREKVLKRPIPEHMAQRELSEDTTNVTTPSTTPLRSASTTRATYVRQTRTKANTERERLKAEKARKTAEVLTRKQEEAREKLMTPLEYATKLQTKFHAALERTPPEKLFLKDKSIFYIGGDLNFASKSTRDKMDFVRKKGGVVVPSFDPSFVTHIVTDAKTGPTLRALGLKSLKDIPDHIPTVTWSWITSGNTGRLGYEFMHAAFASRIDADPSKAPLKRNGNEVGKGNAADYELDLQRGTEFSRIEDFTIDVEGIAPPLVPSPSTFVSSSKLPPTASTEKLVGALARSEDDPLAEFYASALTDRDEAWPHYYENENDDDDEFAVTAMVKNPRGFTCDQKGIKSGVCINQDIIDKLQELLGLHQNKPTDEDKWRAFSYEKTIRALRDYPSRIQSYAEARTIKGVGDKTALKFSLANSKIMEIIETGDLERIKTAKTEDVQALKVFMGIYGVGPKIAYKWYGSGCKTLDDVRVRKGGIVLSSVQEIGVKFYDDINARMPRNEAEDIFNMIKPIALRIDPKLFVEIMGSFRRGKADCGDIDILITRPYEDGKTHAGLLRRLLKELHLQKIITEDLAIPDDFDDLEATYRGLCRRDPRSRRRRLDILTVPYDSRGAALLYYTGDGIFNRAIRYKAGKMGYSLNQRGLYTAVTRDPNDRRKKLTQGTMVASKTEEEIFNILGVPWQEPHERVRS